MIANCPTTACSQELPHLMICDIKIARVSEPMDHPVTFEQSTAKSAATSYLTGTPSSSVAIDVPQ